MASNTAAAIVKSVGGAANIESLTPLRHPAAVPTAGRLGRPAVGRRGRPRRDGRRPQAGDRYQVVIGGGVQNVYNDIMKLPGMGDGGSPDRRGRDQGRRPREGPARQVRLAGLASSSSCPTRSARSCPRCSAPRCSSPSWR